MDTLRRLLRHLWLDADDVRRVLDEDAIDRLEARIGKSEALHTGQICICVEASLPHSYLWRHMLRGEPLSDVVRDRAITLFGKQRVWDTEYNNGVLIYLLLTEHAIEIVADRAVARRVETAQWQSIISTLSKDLRSNQYEAALRQAIAQVSLLLERDFPRGTQNADNELADAPIVR